MNQNNVKKELKRSLTILIPGGILTADLQGKVSEITKKYNLGVYLSTAQNIRLLDIASDEDVQAIKDELTAFGAQIKAPGKFPLPRVCIGSQYCNLGLVDTMALSDKILQKFGGRTQVKPKFKIAISGCPASCSNIYTTDIGIKATKSGYQVYVGGKGGAAPKVGRRIAKSADDEQVLDLISQLVDLHDQKAGKKMRMSKLVSESDFPFEEV